MLLPRLTDGPPESAASPAEASQLLGWDLVEDDALRARPTAVRLSARPCATCFALLSPMSVTYAYDPEEHMLSAQDEAATYWYLQGEEQQSYNESEQAMRILSTAYDLYKGEPQAGEWRYSLSETDNSEGYQVEVKVFF